jgi:hypothetical protein
VRYCDDFVVMCGRESQAREALRRIELVMQQRLRLQLHPEKTRTVGLRKGKEGFVIPGVYDPQEAQDSAESAVSFHASLAVSQGDESTPGPSPGDDECAEQRGRCEADYRQAESRSSRLGELLPNGHELTGVSKDGPIRVFATGALVKSARRAAGNAAGHLDRRTVLGYGSAPPAWDRALPGASRTRKIIVKPCAGKPPARFERGLLKTGWLF